MNLFKKREVTIDWEDRLSPLKLIHIERKLTFHHRRRQSFSPCTYALVVDVQTSKTRSMRPKVYGMLSQFD